MSYNEESNNREKINSSFYPIDDKKDEYLEEIDNKYQVNINSNSNNKIICCCCCKSICRIKSKSKTSLNIKYENGWKLLDASDINFNCIKSEDLIEDSKIFFVVLKKINIKYFANIAN